MKAKARVRRKSDSMWHCNEFYGTGEELMRKVLENAPELETMYRRMISYVEESAKEKVTLGKGGLML